MKYRDFGKTGIKISQLGFGAMRLPEVERDGKWYVDTDKSDVMLRRAYELGVNYFDTAVGYSNGNNESAVGRGVKPFRDKIYISTKLPHWSITKREDGRRILEQSLTRLDTPYIDFYHFHSLNKSAFDEKILALGMIDEMRRAMDEGLIRHLSFSFHDKPENMAYIIERGEGLFSSVLMQYNLLDRANEDALANAHEKGLGTVIMGPVAGGRLAAPSGLAGKLLGEKESSTASLALRFVLGNPNVSCALSGMTDLKMVEENAVIGDMETPMTAEDFELAAERMESLKKFSDLYCTGCGYCIPCPQSINIPYAFESYTYHNVYGMTDLAKDMYKRIGDEKHGAALDSCTECGVCLEKCPQNIDIPNKLKEVRKSLESK